MIEVEEYERLKRKADRLRDEAERAAGALESTMEELREKYDCDTLPEAKKKLAELEETVRKAEERFEKLLKKFEQKWGDKL